MEGMLIQHDEAGVPRYLSFPAGEAGEGLAAQAPRAQASRFLIRNAPELQLKPETLKSLDAPLATLPEEELAGLRVEVEKRVMDSVVIGYAQTYFGLPVIGAGVRVTLLDGARPLQ